MTLAFINAYDIRNTRKAISENYEKKNERENNVYSTIFIYTHSLYQIERKLRILKIEKKRKIIIRVP